MIRRSTKQGKHGTKCHTTLGGPAARLSAVGVAGLQLANGRSGVPLGALNVCLREPQADLIVKVKEPKLPWCSQYSKLRAPFAPAVDINTPPPAVYPLCSSFPPACCSEAADSRSCIRTKPRITSSPQAQINMILFPVPRSQFDSLMQRGTSWTACQ